MELNMTFKSDDVIQIIKTSQKIILIIIIFLFALIGFLLTLKAPNMDYIIFWSFLSVLIILGLLILSILYSVLLISKKDSIEKKYDKLAKEITERLKQQAEEIQLGQLKKIKKIIDEPQTEKLKEVNTANNHE